MGVAGLRIDPHPAFGRDAEGRARAHGRVHHGSDRSRRAGRRGVGGESIDVGRGGPQGHHHTEGESRAEVRFGHAAASEAGHGDPVGDNARSCPSAAARPDREALPPPCHPAAVVARLRDLATARRTRCPLIRDKGPLAGLGAVIDPGYGRLGVEGPHARSAVREVTAIVRCRRPARPSRSRAPRGRGRSASTVRPGRRRSAVSGSGAVRTLARCAPLGDRSSRPGRGRGGTEGTRGRKPPVVPGGRPGAPSWPSVLLFPRLAATRPPLREGQPPAPGFEVARAGTGRRSGRARPEPARGPRSRRRQAEE